MASQDNPEPFPALSPVNTDIKTSPDTSTENVSDTQSTAVETNAHPRRSRGSSLLQTFAQSNPPLGMWQATGEVGSKIPTLPEIRNGSFAEEGWSHEGQMERRGTNPHDIHRKRMERTSSASTRTRKSSAATRGTPVIHEEANNAFLRRPSIPVDRVSEETPRDIIEKPSLADTAAPVSSSTPSENEATRTPTGPDDTGTYPNGYRFPKKHTWTQSIVIGLRAFWKFFLTPFGFLVTIYGLNVVAWGAMIFFILLNAAPAMCNPDCNAPYSARKIWIEIDSQVLNALFCVTGFGLIPWRFRDFYYLMRWRIWKHHDSHRRLAGIYRGWYRLPGSNSLGEHVGPPPFERKKGLSSQPESPPSYTTEEISALQSNPAVPLPVTSMPEPPLTGLRAPPSKSWTLDVVIHMYMLNTVFQACLAGYMWGLNRFDRPAWAVGFFITIGCVTGIVAGIVVFIEGSKVKKAEGIPVKEYDVLESVDDYRVRKEKADKKLAKRMSKESRRAGRHSPNGDAPEVLRTEKVKGNQWFTRH